ncbi:hypothetical protein V3C10_03875 [[Clostridium] symbiosum]|uniref:hypothetical protein n=1 Tax=Clostridium symbiosum TaxID=1512 RepID=UPI001D07CA5E|nr:hypothetical protein [[Clostridium] symbiosum]MCB6610339.1 hypothetical protein [[Clostridium] symbiosum]MCB6931997.1 hypothetical protein [[Clostridium] symbiosum]
MGKRLKHLPERRKLNNTGSAMIMALTIVSLIAILGVMALSTALLNVKMRNLNRRSDKNFYYLETALDEIYAQTGRMASNILKENYVEVMGSLYKDGYRTNDEANLQLKTRFVSDLLADEAFGIEMPLSDDNSGDNRKNAAEKLASFSDTIQEKELDVSIGSIVLEKYTGQDSEPSGNGLKSGMAGGRFAAGGKEIYNGILFKDFCIMYTNPETGIESAITVDLKITAPYVRFMNEGEALLDYVLAANGGIEVNVNGTGSPDNYFAGKIYGQSFTVEHSKTEVASSLFTSAGTLTASKSADLTILPDENTGAQSRVWADGIRMDVSSVLTAENASFFIKDDMTLSGDRNTVTLKGSYYGYGNEGDDGELTKETPNKSSAIIINDRGSKLDMTGLDTLILAGRAYMRFNDAITGQDVYPMGESLAVKATQTIYLLPESSITLEWNGKKEAAGSNPVLLPEEEDAYTLTLHVKLPDNMGGNEAHYLIKVGNPKAADDSGKGISVSEYDRENSPAVPVILNGKVYVYYNFNSENDRRKYFNNYLKNEADSFDELLQKSGMTGGKSPESTFNGGVWIAEGGSSAQINTSGSLYQVAGKDEGEDGHLFQLLEKGQSGVSSSIEWANLIGNLDASFNNLKMNLAETDRVGGRASEAVTGLSAILPIGNYVKVDKVAKLNGEPVFLSNEDESESGGSYVLLSGDSVTVQLDDDGEAKVSTLGRTYTMKGGLVVSAKDIEVYGEGTYNGLLMAAGKISITGSAKLTADGQTFEPILDREEVAEYFYDYSDVASTVLNDYEDFVTRENWSRSGREQGGGK